MNRRIALSLLALVAGLGLAGCVEDESIILPQPSETGRIFQRYVSMGNSLTAGFMSGGINDSTQRLAYPVRLAARAEAGFAIPSLAMPGCPPPLLGVLDTTEAGDVVLETDRVGGGTAESCSLRGLPIPQVVQNVAVPGSKMADALDTERPGNASNALTTLLLGGQTQVEAMRRANPSLVTSWLGNNDVLGAALRGDISLLTPVDTFAFYWERIASGIAGSGALGVVIVGVLDPELAPVLQPGLYYWVADSLGFAPKPVSADCAPTNADGTLNPLSMNTVSALAFADSLVAEVSCDPAADYVLTRQESDSIASRVAAFNALLQTTVQERQWMFVNATSVVEAALLSSAGRQRLRQCEFLDNTDPLDEIVGTVVAQCPHASAPNFYGSLMSFDGIHMSGAAHQLMSDAIAIQLNGRFDLGL